MTSRTVLDTRLREAQELNAASRVRPASKAFRALLRDVAPLDPATVGSWVVELRVRALVGEASCVHALTGDLTAARRMIDEALQVAQDADDQRLAAVAHGQHGLLLLWSGEPHRAVSAFDRALAGVAPENHRDRAVLHINRAAAGLENGALDDVVADHERALHHARAIGHERYEAFAGFNLGYAYYRQGDFPAALAELETAVRRNPDGRDGWSEVTRAQVLVDAGLVSEAEQVLADSAGLLAVDNLAGEVADALYTRALCALLLRRPDEAARWARQARRAFARVGNTTWALQAQVVELEARLSQDRRARTSRRATLLRRSDEALALARAGDDRGPAAVAGVSVAARLLAAEWALLARDTDRASAVLAEAPRRLTACPLPLRLHHESVRAQLAFAVGDRRAGLAAVRRGHDVLADHRARLGSVDAVTAAATHGARLAVVDVEAALSTGRPGTVFDATERGRAAFAGAARVRPPEDPELADLMARARRAAEEARELGAGEGDDAQEAARKTMEARRLQERARQRSWQLGGSAGGLVPRPATARGVSAGLAAEPRDAAVVSFLLRDRVTAVRVDARGSRLVELAPQAEVTELSRRVRQDLEVLANRLIPAPMRQVAAQSARRSLSRLDEMLLVPLEVEGPLYVAARDGLLSLPWQSLPSRDRRATRVHSWVDLRETPVASHRRGALVVGGPDLESAEREAGLVAGEWDEAVLLTGADATCAATTAELSRAAVVHVAAHGVHEPDNPLFSCVRLADGPLFAHELDGVDLGGAVVVLSACEVGRASTRVGGEPLGLKSVLLRLGARAVIASVAPLRDDVAARVMPRLHAALAAGEAPAAALAAAVEPEDEPVPLVCYGPLPLPV
ncbi:CHAT domain-containing protein [Isoptericola dokdonensis]|uniref:CHAT domain protein n=1 Tax=Isoptericola dokdonensis DS-3 TaxID=1300344 RepID=A0A161IL73_9MICO|nr:CHAT domain-containing protein [Isoptericola dokdonensis]ANC31200.1 CHAT domain protein [Isoptericola dokdonensis DS-3]